jgi:hypothetical protein
MAIPYGARVSERWFLNQPGFHGGAYVLAYLEDTSELHPRPEEWCDEDCRECPHNFEPDSLLEIADCRERIELEMDFGTEAGRMNSLHKLDTLIAALRVFRTGLAEEFAEYERRERELAEIKGE